MQFPFLCQFKQKPQFKFHFLCTNAGGRATIQGKVFVYLIPWTSETIRWFTLRFQQNGNIKTIIDRKALWRCFGKTCCFRVTSFIFINFLIYIYPSIATLAVRDFYPSFTLNARTRNGFQEQFSVIRWINLMSISNSVVKRQHTECYSENRSTSLIF
jgi:hypothetical protein